MCKCEILYLEQMVLGAYVDPANSGFRYSVLVFGGKHLPDPDYPPNQYVLADRALKEMLSGCDCMSCISFSANILLVQLLSWKLISGTK